jgi:hypothetical protein
MRENAPVLEPGLTNARRSVDRCPYRVTFLPAALDARESIAGTSDSSPISRKSPERVMREIAAACRMTPSPTPHTMKKIVWTFGLIAGVILSLMMVLSIRFVDSLGESGLLLGYSTMVAAFLLIYFGVRSYRDNVLGGTIGFGRAFATGMLIAAIGGVCYTATWEVMYYKFMPDFGVKYGQRQVEHARQQGKSDAEVAKVQADMQKFAEQYRNPLYNSAMTFLEPLPVGVLISLISAGVLRRKRRGGATALATA